MEADLQRAQARIGSVNATKAGSHTAHTGNGNDSQRYSIYTHTVYIVTLIV